MGNDYASFLQQTPWEKVWRLWLPRLIPAAIGLILIAAAILKSMDMELFIRQIKSYGIISHYDLIVISAWALIVIELALGAALLLFYRPSASIMVAALLIGIFALVNGWAWFNGGVEDCGCFGAWVKRTPAEGIIEDLVLLAALCMAWVIRPTIHRPIDFNPSGYKKWIILTSCILGLLLPVAFGFSPLKFNETKTNSINTRLAQLQPNGLEYIDLKNGSYLAVIMDTECIHCQDSAFDIDTLVEAENLPSIIALSPNDEDQRKKFAAEFQPLFPIGQITEEDFWELLGDGEIPRTILIQEGVLIKVWDKDIPDENTIKEANNMS